MLPDKRGKRLDHEIDKHDPARSTWTIKISGTEDPSYHTSLSLSETWDITTQSGHEFAKI